MIYLDTSALVRLVQVEPNSAALRDFLAKHPATTRVSSVLIAIETRRAALRDRPEMLPRADLALSGVNQIGLSHAIVESASRLPDPSLRSLDAIHLATALLLGDELSAFVTYDIRLAKAAKNHSLPVTAPGQTPPLAAS